MTNFRQKKKISWASESLDYLCQRQWTSGQFWLYPVECSKICSSKSFMMKVFWAQMMLQSFYFLALPCISQKSNDFQQERRKKSFRVRLWYLQNIPSLRLSFEKKLFPPSCTIHGNFMLWKTQQQNTNCNAFGCLLLLSFIHHLASFEEVKTSANLRKETTGLKQWFHVILFFFGILSCAIMIHQ